MASLVEVATYWPAGVSLNDQQEDLGLTAVELRTYLRAFGLAETRRDPEQSEAELLLAAARKLAWLPGQEERVKYVLRARTLRSAVPYPISPMQEVRHELGLSHAQAFTVTDHACAGGLLALDLAGLLLSRDPDPDALALVLTGEKGISRHGRLIPRVAITGDAVAAVLVGQSNRDRILSYATHTHPMATSGLVMDKQEFGIFRRIYPETLTKVVQGALDLAGTRPEQVALLLPHNVNRPAWLGQAEQLGIPLERVFLDNIPRTGHCFCADPMLNYRTVADLGLLQPGDRYVLTSVGLGATFSAMVIEH